MTIAHLLEDFGMASIPEPAALAAAAAVSEEVVEEQRLISFEKGYSAGWDDAVTAQDKDTQRISATRLPAMRISAASPSRTAGSPKAKPTSTRPSKSRLAAGLTNWTTPLRSITTTPSGMASIRPDI